MKSVSTLLVAACLSIPALEFAESPAVAAKPARVDFCKEAVVPFNPEQNLGECNSVTLMYSNYVEKGTGNTQAVGVHECDLLREQDPDFYYAAFASNAECIEYVKNSL